MTKSAYLRVYSPEVSGSNDPVPGFVRTYGLLSEAEGETQWTVEWNGQRLVCPRNLRLRVLESTIAFANAFRGMGAGLIPETEARAADRELRAYHRNHPEHRSHVLTSAWHVPVRWFAAFEPGEKEVYEGHEGPCIRFRADMGAARRRVRAAHTILSRMTMFSGPAQELDRLLDWLIPFPETSMLELDYGEVSTLFDPQDLVLDDSCDQIRQSLEALADGDLLRAGECYGRVVTRWAPAFSVTFSN